MAYGTVKDHKMFLDYSYKHTTCVFNPPKEVVEDVEVQVPVCVELGDTKGKGLGGPHGSPQI